MAHRMGLVVLDMTTGKSVTETRTMTYDTNARTTDETCLISNSTSTTTIYPCHEFNTSSGYTGTLLNASTSGKDCYYIVKCSPTVASSEIKVGCISTERKEYWDDVNVGAGLHSGECVSRQINSNRTFANLVALFSYVNTIQTITLPWYGDYMLEVWGAQGGWSYNSNTNAPGKGGYASGIYTAKRTLFVAVGSQGATGASGTGGAGGYNGGGKGGNAGNGGGGGGGATHMATSTGILSSLASNTSAVIIAAGGGGGNCNGGGGGDKHFGGVGSGGATGGKSTNSNNGSNYNSAWIFAESDGGDNTKKVYAFGQGQNGITSNGGTAGSEGNGGGGGGYYGGCSLQATGSSSNAGGGGGSGYTAGLGGVSTSSGVREGNGYAKITSQ